MAAPTDRRAQILSAAKRVFAKKGFHSASVDDIITKAGIARGTFYLYFKGKRDIFDTLLKDLLEELQQMIQPVRLAPEQPKPLDQLKANVRRVLELVVREPDLSRILLHHASGLDEQSSAVLRGFYERLLSMIERSLGDGVRLGLVRPCDTRTVAACVLGTIKEVADWQTLQQKSNLDAVAEEVVRFGLRGLAASLWGE